MRGPRSSSLTYFKKNQPRRSDQGPWCRSLTAMAIRSVPKGIVSNESLGIPIYGIQSHYARYNDFPALPSFSLHKLHLCKNSLQRKCYPPHFWPSQRPFLPRWWQPRRTQHVFPVSMVMIFQLRPTITMISVRSCMI
jgi:hypothetical protein